MPMMKFIHMWVNFMEIITTPQKFSRVLRVNVRDDNEEAEEEKITSK